ncbi:DHHC palmitoyltransferase-domain-containing protein, partial [Parasitella parasitica]
MCMESNKNDEKHTDFDDPDEHDPQTCCCCHSDSPMYAKLWPLIFFLSALTDFPMPLPKGKKPGQHRDWGLVPVLIVTGMAAFIYYGYVHSIVLVLLKQLDRQAQAIAYLVPFNILCIFFLISYGRIASQTPGHPNTLRAHKPASTKNQTSNSSAINIDLAQQKPDSILGDPRWCHACQIWKPDRAHHCRVCDACVLRMDHHCPWVNGCVGAFNYRYYIQFLCYVSLFASFTFSTSLAAFVEFHGLSIFDNVALAIVIISGVVTLLIGTFTMSHIWLVLLNRTTIENSQFQSWNNAKKSGNADNRLIDVFTENGRNVFNQGCWNNWVEVMGRNVVLWF